MFVDINDKEIPQEELTVLFTYEDFLKASILNGHAGKVALRHLKDTYKKIYVARPEKKEQHIECLRKQSIYIIAKEFIKVKENFMDILDRCNELEEMIDKLNELLDTVQSKDIKGDIEDLIGKYYGEYKELDEQLTKQEEEDSKYLESEYWRNAI